MKQKKELTTLANVISYCSLRLHQPVQQQVKLDAIQFANMLQSEFVEFQDQVMPKAIAKRCLKIVHNIQVLLSKLPTTKTLDSLQYQLTILQTYFYELSTSSPQRA